VVRHKLVQRIVEAYDEHAGGTDAAASRRGGPLHPASVRRRR
jgi:hypothetical protein